jgi:hypothetical protein
LDLRLLNFRLMRERAGSRASKRSKVSGQRR